jgi:ferredoxin-NADP reductase
MIIDPYVWYKTPILAIAHIATDTVAVTVAKPDDYSYAPGQYALLQISLDPTEKFIRQYSFSSEPSSPRLEFIIRKLPGGKVSSWLHDRAKVGDMISITKPYGRFEKVPTAAHHVLVAGGVGLAPFLSMLRDNPSHTSLLYSEGSQDKVTSDSELTKLLGDSYHLVLSEETGRIKPPHFRDLIGDGYTYYLCGSKNFIDSIEAQLINTVGVTREKIVREAFTLQ